MDLGLDMRFLNDRLTVSLDYYNKNTKDLLVKINPVPEVYTNQTTVNAGKVTTKALNSKPVGKTISVTLHTVSMRTSLH